MYIAAAFKETRPEVLFELIEQYPLGTLMTQGQGGLDAIHIPFEVVSQHQGETRLRGHIARANPLWQQVEQDADVLVVFHGGDAYISPNWYPSKQQTHRQVPTWNYRVVHARGKIAFHHDAQFLREILASLTGQHESTQPVPWKMTDSSEDFIQGMLKGVVGVEIVIKDIIGCFKLGQNKKPEDLKGAGENVITAGQEAIGTAMLSHLK
ncbi:FMN-binding negative transcriptional regulator [Serratia sp. M24T3]|uniref:FMN-binding negative transcriptional regulator n=1 Tax=Serratia sp. M24T3 TaxID=932213 RepID=UPI00025BB416|nr:FMN-binding negative transcriptional regulator [Serratia sp. M24T3]EIC85353.1 transcriptional regulator [Serratia sp. M24T3]